MGLALYAKQSYFFTKYENHFLRNHPEIRSQETRDPTVHKTEAVALVPGKLGTWPGLKLLTPFCKQTKPVPILSFYLNALLRKVDTIL